MIKKHFPYRFFILTVLSLSLNDGIHLFAQTPSGTTILDQATAKYTFKNQQTIVASNIVSFIVASQPNFDCAYSLADSNVIVGDTVRIGLTFRNTGNTTADTLTIENTISNPGLKLVEVSGNGVVKGDSIVWRRFNIAPLESGSEFFTVVIPPNFPAGAFLAASGKITWQSFSKTFSQYLIVGSFARLEVSVAPSLTVVGSGRTIDYQIVVENTGNRSALSVVLTDTLGSTGTMQQAFPSPDIVLNGGNVVQWNIGTLPASSQYTVSMTVRTFSNLGTSQIRNVAFVSASNVSRTSSQETVTPIVPVHPATMTLHPSTEYIFGQANEDSAEITATVFDSSGSPLGDGVPVAFKTNLGTFLKNGSSLTVFTSNGQASVYLHSADVANVVRTASVTAAAGVSQTGTVNGSVTIIMYPSAITGFVKQKVGKELVPLPGAIVRVYSNYDTAHYAGIDTSNSHGLYFVALNQDVSAKYFTVKITAFDNFGETVTSSLIFTQGENPEPATTVLNSIAGRLQYRGMNASVPAPEVTVFLDSLGQPTAHGMGIEGTSTLSFRVRQSTTDENGRYLFENLQPALYKIWVDSSKFPQYSGVDTVSLTQAGIFTINANIFVQVDSSALMAMTSPDTVFADSSYLLFVHVANTGNINHTNVVLRDTLNQKFIFLGAAQAIFDSLNYNTATHVAEWRAATMPQKIDTTLWLKVGFVPNIPDGTVLTNTAWMKSDQLGAWLRSQRTMVVRSSPKMGFGQFVEGGSDSVVAGYPVKLGLWFSNTGTDSLHSVMIRDSIFHAGMSGIAVQFDTSKYVLRDSAEVHDSVVTWNVHSIPPGVFDTLHISLRTDPRLAGGVAITSKGSLLQNGVEVFSARQTVTTVSNSGLSSYLVITKTGNKRTAEIGDVVTYQIVVTNNSPDSLYSLQIIDKLPYAFEYYKGSGHYNGKALEPMKQNRTLSWALNSPLPKGAPATLVYQLVLGADALESDGMNGAIATAKTLDGAPLYSASAHWQVAVKPGVFTDRGVIFGKVFYDDDRNAYQSDGEDGIKNVEIWMEDGTRITTGDNGKYSLPNVKPGEHVLRVNERTLPKGSELVLGKHDFAEDASSRFVTLTEGGIARANFYVKRTLADSISLSVSKAIRLAARKVESPAEVFVSSGVDRGNTAECTLQVNYSGPASIQRIRVVDSLPDGFSYFEGSGMFNGRPTEPVVDGALLHWNLGRGVSPFEGELRYRVQIRSTEPREIPERSFSYVEVMNADSLVTKLDALWTTTYVRSYFFHEALYKIHDPVFEHGKISLRRHALKTFDSIRTIVQNDTASYFIIVGFPDVPSKKSRRSEDSLLAHQRGETVLDYLYRRLGKDSIRVSAEGIYATDTTGEIDTVFSRQTPKGGGAAFQLALIKRDYFLNEPAQKTGVDSVEDFSAIEAVPELQKYYRDSIDVSPDDHLLFRVHLFSNPQAENKTVTVIDSIPTGISLQLGMMLFNEIPIYPENPNGNLFVSDVTTLIHKGVNEIQFGALPSSVKPVDTVKMQIWLRRANNFNEETLEKANLLKLFVRQKRLPLFEHGQQLFGPAKRATTSSEAGKNTNPIANERGETFHPSVKLK
ncbi:MAG: DUF11 domain-containing protein [Bacteroidota bacterium]|nr:DUF11 domain-containing protein [Bacteroidota bacterium]